MSTQLVIPLASFAVELLPEGARTPGTPEFREAVTRHIGQDYARHRKVALVTLDESHIFVSEFASVDEALNHIVPLLKSGRLNEALPLLESLTKGQPANAHVLYNLGITYSELGQFDEAVIRLKRCLQAQPKRVHAWVGLGTAYERLGKLDLARAALEKAVTLAPKDGYAQRNLGAILGQLKRPREALPHLRKAVSALPDDRQALYGLAITLYQLKDDPKAQAEADSLLARFIALFPEDPLAEEARTLRTAYAQTGLKRGSIAGLRPDVMFYILGALQRFAERGDAWRQAVTFEIALLGRQGLDVHDPAEKYTLRNLAGTFSGLHLLSIMYAGFRQIDPAVDTGADFVEEYAMAASLHEAQKTKPAR